MSSIRSASSSTITWTCSRVRRAAVEQVEQPARGRDQQVRLARLLDLRLDADAAEDGQRLEPARLRERPGVVHDLRRQLAGGREDERGGAPGPGVEGIEDRRDERQGLARPGG